MDKPNKSTISPVTIIEELKILKLEPRKPVIKPTINNKEPKLLILPPPAITSSSNCK